jgi:hypothetical protein
MLSGVARLIANHRSSTSSQAHQKSGPFPPPALPGLAGTMTLSDSRQHRRPRRRRGRDPRAWRVSPDDPRHPPGVPCPLPRWTAAGASVGCFPTACSLPRFPAGSASTTSLSRPAQASLALRPVGSLSRPRRPLSRGFDPPGCPDKPLVSYQINRQLPGWNLPPLVTRAVWAHVESGTGAVAWAMSASLRFPSPLIKPDVRISRIRLSDWLHLKAHGMAPR